MNSAKDNAKRVCAEIHRVLVTEWDPIGVMGDPEWPRDEYDRYIGQIFGFLVRGESAEFLARHLCFLEDKMMGLGPVPASERLEIARKLLAIDTCETHRHDRGNRTEEIRMWEEQPQRVNAWKQSGRISLWRYTENEGNYPGWHLNADAAGCRSLLELLDAFSLDGSGSRTIAVTPPTAAQLQVPNYRHGAAAWVAPEKWCMTFSSAPDDWIFPPDLHPATLTLGSSWFVALRNGLTDIPAGRGDWSTGHRKGELSLWFWWSVRSG